MNTCYKHFYYFVTEFDLINEKEYAPLQEMTKRICTDIIAPPTPTGKTEEYVPAISIEIDKRGDISKVKMFNPSIS